jgi:Zn-dependent membrane protease YugP
MLYLILFIIVIAILFGPSYWINYVYKKYNNDIEDCPGTGGELAVHLLERANIDNVEVVRAKDVDYYDLNKRQVVLSESVYDGKSVTAIAVSAHEVGHAMQHFQGYSALMISARWSGIVDWLQRVIMQTMLVLSSVASIFLHAPIYKVVFIAGVVIAIAKVLLNFATLPAELDASFKKALPMLSEGYLPKQYHQPAKILLTAAAFTYVAKALADVINIFKWFILFRR